MSRDGMNYAPEMKTPRPVVAPGEFVFAASHFDHGHIYGQISGLTQAGGVLKYVYDPDETRLASVLQQNPGARRVTDFREILDDPALHLVTSAAIPCDLSLIHISEPTRLRRISYAVFCTAARASASWPRVVKGDLSVR